MGELPSTLKSAAIALALVAVFALGQSIARADEVTVAGSTTGTITGVLPLTFAGNVFSGTTALGIGSLSGNDRLGTFTLATAPEQMLSGAFTLNITFTAPAGIVGGQSTTYTASIAGSVSPNVGQGGVLVHFTTPSTVFSFTNGATTGTFTLTIADVFVQSGQTANLTAGITGAQQTRTTVPEPASMVLLGTGLVGVASLARYRKRNAK